MQSSSGSIFQAESDVNGSNPLLAGGSITSNLSSKVTLLLLTAGTVECEGSLTGGESDLQHKTMQAFISFIKITMPQVSPISN